VQNLMGILDKAHEAQDGARSGDIARRNTFASAR